MRGTPVIVADASAILDLLLRTTDSERIEERLLGARESLHAPALLDVEVVHALRRRVARKEISEARGETALTLLARLPLTRYMHDPLVRRVWALRHNLTAYDAAYVALAEGLDAILITRDSALSAASGHRARIELV